MEESNHNVPGGGWFKLERFRGRIVMKRDNQTTSPMRWQPEMEIPPHPDLSLERAWVFDKAQCNGFRRGFETVNFIIN